jgi:glycosyltransferase involved in cell wall biosynthesis
MRSVLYITYDGLTDPLGQSQILAYLKRLGKENRIVILSFEKKESFNKESGIIQEIIDQNNLIWMPTWYTPTPPIFSTLYDIRKGLRLAMKLHREYQFQLVHCRGYIPSIIGRELKSKFGLKFIFDMRGWWADEKKESGFWSKKIYQPVYNYFKKLERKFFRDADYSVSLTYKGKEEIEKQNLAPSNKIGVIPTCVDFEIFKPWDSAFRRQMRRQLGIDDSEKVFVYSGSLGGNYDPQILIDVFKSFQGVYAESYLLILSKDQLSNELRSQFSSRGIHRMAIYNMPFTKVTDYLRCADAGFIYYKMSFSVIGRSPTKLGEYWASGIPVVAFEGIGDLDYILKIYPDSGILLSKNKSKWPEEMKLLSFPAPMQLRNYSEDYFHVNKGVLFYQNVYQSLVPAKEVYEPSRH